MGTRPLSLEVIFKKGFSLVAGFLLEVAFTLFVIVFLVMGIAAVFLLFESMVG